MEESLIDAEVPHVAAVSDMGRRGMAPLWILDRAGSDGLALFVLIDGTWADHTSHECFPFRKTMAVKMGWGLRRLDGAIESLQKCGALTVTKRHRPDGSRTSSLYRLHFVPGCANEAPPLSRESTTPSRLEQGVVASEHKGYREPAIGPIAETREQELPIIEHPLSTNKMGEASHATTPLCVIALLGELSSRAQDDRVRWASEYDEDFANWYSIWPNRQAPRRAWKAWKAATKRKDVESIMLATVASLPGFATRERRYVPHPASWLNADGWDAEPVTPEGTRSAVDEVFGAMERHGVAPGETFGVGSRVQPAQEPPGANGSLFSDDPGGESGVLVGVVV